MPVMDLKEAHRGARIADVNASLLQSYADLHGFTDVLTELAGEFVSFEKREAR